MAPDVHACVAWGLFNNHVSDIRLASILIRRVAGAFHDGDELGRK